MSDAALILAKAFGPPKKDEPEAEFDPMEGLRVAAQELILGVERKDPGAVAMAFKNAFEILESMPHEEGG